MAAPVLSVVEAGSLFPRRGELRVHSVFHSAVNLIGADAIYPVALVAHAVHRHPRSAVLAAPGRLDEWGLQSGDRAVFEGSRLRFDRSNVPELNLGSAAAFTETVPPIEVSEAALTRAAALLTALQERAETRVRWAELSGGESPLMRRFAAAAGLLSTRFAEGAAGLIGLGDGLTPSGDDFLVGWMASTYARGRDAVSLGALKERTNVISASFLDSAERGLFASALIAFAQALGSPGDARRALDDLARIGHSSGLDSATGFLFGLALQGGVYETGTFGRSAVQVVLK